ncbi:hypothetical protein J6590_067514 [Homalodisca vitripennis]|nr:hypothetical protein J6590_067514 [Homalodisca vitripennis]
MALQEPCLQITFTSQADLSCLYRNSGPSNNYNFKTKKNKSKWVPIRISDKKLFLENPLKPRKEPVDVAIRESGDEVGGEGVY